jgi:hypothetical protein
LSHSFSTIGDRPVLVPESTISRFQFSTAKFISDSG